MSPTPTRRTLLAWTLAAVLAPPASTSAAWRPPPSSTAPEASTTAPVPRGALGGELQDDILEARDAVLPALVHVEPILQLYRRGQAAKAAVTGSGVVVDGKGHVLTNDHVVANARRVTCILYDKREVPARVVGRDTFTDVAVLQLELPPDTVPPPARLGSSESLTAGQFVIAMGSPLGLARSISVGVVSTPDRYFPEDVLPSGGMTGAYNTWIQTDAAINPGNSGGPLVDLTGRIIGINARAIPIFGENIGFAIPIDVVKEVAAHLIERGRVDRSWIGVRWQHLKSLAGYFGADERGGVLVGGLVPDGPAATAGFEAGDVVVEWDGEPVSARFEEELPRFRKNVADTPIGTTVPVTLLRRGREKRLRVTTALRPDTESDEVELPAWGLTAKDLTPELIRRERLQQATGALVTGVKAAAPASVAGLREGDLLREIEGREIADTTELLQAYDDLQAAETERILVKAARGATLRVFVLEPDWR